MPAGLQEQIDELDQLLDKLLKLPIESARPAPATIPISSPVALAVVNDVDEEVEEDADPQTPILRFDGGPIKEVEETEINDNSDLLVEPALTPDPPSPSPDPSPLTPDLSLITPDPSATTTSEETSQKLPVDEMPWLEDEPPAYVTGAGPQIEIIHGPTSQMVVAPGAVEETHANAKATRRSWLHWLLWTWTWCFDHTLGLWFPWLRRPGVKFLLGLIGVALCAVSLYLVWIGWRR